LAVEGNQRPRTKDGEESYEPIVCAEQRIVQEG
jgi:hypothetical protein